MSFGGLRKGTEQKERGTHLNIYLHVVVYVTNDRSLFNTPPPSGKYPGLAPVCSPIVFEN